MVKLKCRGKKNQNVRTKSAFTPLKFRIILAYLPFFLGVRYLLVGNLLYQVTKISNLMVSSSHCVVLTSHITVLLSHLVVLLFFLTFDGNILTLCSTNITCDYTFVTFGSSLIFFFIFDGIILTLCSINITCDCIFVTFNGFLFCFFSHFMVPSSHYVIPKSHVTIFLSHSVVPLFFLTFDGTILTLCSTNITCDCIFVTFGNSLILFYFHILWYHPHIK